MENKFKKIIFLGVTIFGSLVFLTGCSSETVQLQNTSNTVNSVNLSVEEIPFLDSFIQNYNAISTTPISNCIDFVVSDNNSKYYRTEFRLLAFEKANSKHGNIGTSEIDMIDYSSVLENIHYTKFRVYIKSENIDENKKNASTIIKILDSSISDESIQEAYKSMSNSFLLGNYIKGTISKDEIMIDFSKIDYNY